ncbi:MAG TPA: hypothetical protein VN770_01305 [Gaiellaceae bacterium]|nr:hypothetical protein [Gaiellaceae bacterium]
MELAAGMWQREVGLDLLAAHLSALDPDHERARERLDRVIGPQMAQFLVGALIPHPYAQSNAA